MGIIYKVTNKVNGKSYIGKTKISLEYRRYHHEQKARTGCKYLFHRAILAYGSESFEWEIVFDGEVDNATLNRIEIQLIKEENCKLPNGYNMTDGGEGGMRGSGWRHSDEVRKKCGFKNKGRKLSEEHKQKIRVALFGNQNSLGVEHSQETRKKWSLIRRGRVVSEETKKRLSAATTAYYAKKRAESAEIG